MQYLSSPPQTPAFTSQQISTKNIALLQEMKDFIQTLKADQPISTPSSSAAISPEFISYLDEIRNDIELIKVRVNVVHRDLEEMNTYVKMMACLKEEIKSCSILPEMVKVLNLNG